MDVCDVNTKQKENFKVRCVIDCVIENNVPYISGHASQQWVVEQASSVNFTISDADDDTVEMFPLTPLPSGSTFVQLPGLNTWQFVWTPVNMDPVELL